MKKTLTGLLLAAGLLAGCQTQPQQPVEWPQLTIGPKARSYLQIEAVPEGVASGNLLRAGVRLYNRSQSEQTLRYRFSWTDANGFELPGMASRWEQRILRPGEPVALDRVAPGPAATSYRIYLFDINTGTATHTQGIER
ncbi:DUF1425 domain-containing protein [Marinobacterium sp. MBR-109]|jgi:uncharacterized protein YcfL|uniref:DUF1425 domain-containing protein n=1 Tax=Marinobacterium sp. MBR-109 TaxID=3156462 RepID=UPI0033967C37